MSCDSEAEEAREQAIADALASPKSAEVDGRKVESRPVAELIEADKYLRRRCAQRAGAFPVRLFQVKPPGAV